MYNLQIKFKNDFIKNVYVQNFNIQLCNCKISAGNIINLKKAVLSYL